MTKIDPAELRKLVEGITPGKWQMSGVRGRLGSLNAQGSFHGIAVDDEIVAAIFYDERTHLGFRDAKYIAYALTNAQALLDMAERVAALEDENDTLKGLVHGWHYLAVGPDEMGDYYTHKQLVKLSEPYASPALKGGQ